MKVLLQLNNIHKSYGALVVLEDATVSFLENQKIGVIGRNGAGKSTLIDIFTGLLTPVNGDVYYLDKPIRHENMTEYRKNIGYVPQHIFLIDDTIEANIAFGIDKDRIDRVKLDNVIKLAQLDTFTESLKDGVHTKVGERGVRLSGGQRQRIGIARALYRQPRILILDEATSALDGHTESEVVRAVEAMKKEGIAVILAAHRFSTISSADMIYVMDRGKIVDAGKPEDLMEKSEIFKKILHQKASSGSEG